MLSMREDKTMFQFKITDRGSASLVVGIRITRDCQNSRKLTISQENHAKSVLEEFGMANCNPLQQPKHSWSGIGSELSLDQPEEKVLDPAIKQRNQSITGSLIY